MNSPRWTAAALAVAAALAAPSLAGPDALEIVREADRRQRTSSEFYEGRLSITTRKGKVREKAWRHWRKGHGGESRTVIQFTDPAEVAGVSLLTYVHSGRDDEQWMWTPSINRERRIAPQQKSTRFLGTDFTYEDLSERVIEDWSYDHRKEEPCGGATCWVIEAEPAGKKTSQYSMTIMWFRQTDYALMKMEMEKEGDPKRRMVFSDHRTVQGIVTAGKVVLTDLQRGSRTELSVSDIRYDVDLPESFFTLRSLNEIHAAPE